MTLSDPSRSSLAATAKIAPGYLPRTTGGRSGKERRRISRGSLPLNDQLLPLRSTLDQSPSDTQIVQQRFRFEEAVFCPLVLASLERLLGVGVDCLRIGERL
jgi:hypothetical protein